MAIDLSKTPRIVLFEIDRKDFHNLARFHRNISQLTVEGKIAADDFEEVIGMYKGKMNVAYAMRHAAFLRAFHRIEWYMRGQTELYDYDFTHNELVSWGWHWRFSWTQRKLGWADGWAVGRDAPDTDGWTYFPSSGEYLTITGTEDV
jgi:hypothetical protein